MSSLMEFWGVEVKGNKPLKVSIEEGDLIHLSHATLAEPKKGGEPVVLSVKVGNQKLNLGVLSADNAPQLTFDLVFEQDFELSHNSKNGSIHLLGYKNVDDGEPDGMLYDSSDEEEEEMPVAVPIEKKPSGKPAVTAAAPAAKSKAAAVSPKKEDKVEESDEDDDSEEDDDDDEVDSEDESDDEEMHGSDDEDDSEEDESDEEDTPAKPVDAGKKRSGSATKTPDAKKVKIATTPQKTEGKKPAGGQTATPHPAKKSGKATANGDKSNSKTPKSAGQVTCGSCNRNFTNDKALESHSKAKHGAK